SPVDSGRKKGDANRELHWDCPLIPILHLEPEPMQKLSPGALDISGESCSLNPWFGQLSGNRRSLVELQRNRQCTVPERFPNIAGTWLKIEEVLIESRGLQVNKTRTGQMHIDLSFHGFRPKHCDQGDPPSQRAQRGGRPMANRMHERDDAQ